MAAVLKNLPRSSQKMLLFTKKLGNNAGSLKNLRFQSIIAKKLIYSKYGEPMEVVSCEQECLATPDSNEILVKMLAAPINPSDINTIQGVYPIKPPLPAVPGNEGTGEVLTLGSNVTEFQVGDRVIPRCNSLGTWRTHLMCSKNDLRKVSNELGVLESATLAVNPCTAYRMLQDFVKLQPDNTIIQNGANSAVGQNVIQMCKLCGYRTVNVVRNRENIEDLKELLKELGATCVFTEEELKVTDVFKSGRLPKPKLALNCVGGKSAKEMLRHMDDRSIIVTYGGMSREPVTVPTSAFIFKNVRCCGFWITSWNKEHAGTSEQEYMMEDITNMFINCQLKVPVHKLVTFDNYKEALENTINRKGFAGVKYIFDFRCQSL